MGACTSDAFKFEPEQEQSDEDIFNLFTPMVNDGSAQQSNDSADRERGIEP